MHNLSDRRRLFSRLQLDKLCATDSTETGKPKVSCYQADRKERAQERTWSLTLS